MINNLIKQPKIVKPFLKWAGGKSQLLPEFEKRFPEDLKNGKIINYYEPFLGGGAVFFFIRSNFPCINNFYLYDINPELILAYSVVQKDVYKLIEALESLKSLYNGSSDKKGFFLSIRKKYNSSLPSIDFHDYTNKWIERTSQMLFLNKTCFNGLFRVNSKGEFNVPFGSYKNPSIVNADNLIQNSRLLQNVKLKIGSFQEFEKDVKNNSFLYFDPPYRPLNATSSFTSYSKYDFNDTAQEALAEVFKRLAKRKSLKLMLSNSDTLDGYFDKLYNTDGIIIQRILAKRMINCDASKRGVINELLITNY